MVAGAAPAALAAETAAHKQLEIKARTAFVAGRYQDAADLYAELYGTTLHPVYLRNLGRCHQKLGNPERAIELFGDYLKKARGLDASERQEIDGYIAEMEKLKAERAAAAPAAPVLPPSAPEAPREIQAAPVTTLTAPAPAEPETPLYRRWWLWTALGVVAAGGATAFVLTRDPAPRRPACAALECQ